MARFRRLGDRPYRTIVGAGIIFGDPDDQAGDDQAEQRAIEQRAAGETAHIRFHAAHGIADREPDRRNRKNRGNKEALVHRTHDIGAAAQTDEIGTDDRGYDTHTANEEREAHQVHQQRTVGYALHQKRDEDHRCANGDDIGFEQIRGHTGAVTNIVTDIVGDNCRVAWIVFRNACFDLADKVGADVCSLGEDTTAETCEDRDERCAKCQSDQSVDNGAAVRFHHGDIGQIPEEHGNREQGETSDKHAGDRTRTERHGQASLQAGLRSSCRTHVRTHRDVHPDITGNTGKHGADDEADGRNDAQERGNKHSNDHTNNGDGAILAAQIGLCAFLNGSCDFLHFFIACRGAQHLAAGDEAVDYGQDTANNCD